MILSSDRRASVLKVGRPLDVYRFKLYPGPAPDEWADQPSLAYLLGGQRAECQADVRLDGCCGKPPPQVRARRARFRLLSSADSDCGRMLHLLFRRVLCNSRALAD